MIVKIREIAQFTRATPGIPKSKKSPQEKKRVNEVHPELAF